MGKYVYRVFGCSNSGDHEKKKTLCHHIARLVFGCSNTLMIKPYRLYIVDKSDCQWEIISVLLQDDYSSFTDKLHLNFITLSHCVIRQHRNQTAGVTFFRMFISRQQDNRKARAEHFHRTQT